MSGVGLGMSRGMGTHPLRTWDTTGYSRQVGGMHPTGMLSCLSMFESGVIKGTTQYEY